MSARAKTQEEVLSRLMKVVCVEVGQVLKEGVPQQDSIALHGELPVEVKDIAQSGVPQAFLHTLDARDCSFHYAGLGHLEGELDLSVLCERLFAPPCDGAFLAALKEMVESARCNRKEQGRTQEPVDTILDDLGAYDPDISQNRETALAAPENSVAEAARLILRQVPQAYHTGVSGTVLATGLPQYLPNPGKDGQAWTTLFGQGELCSKASTPHNASDTANYRDILQRLERLVFGIDSQPTSVLALPLTLYGQVIGVGYILLPRPVQGPSELYRLYDLVSDMFQDVAQFDLIDARREEAAKAVMAALEVEATASSSNQALADGILRSVPAIQVDLWTREPGGDEWRFAAQSPKNRNDSDESAQNNRPADLAPPEFRIDDYWTDGDPDTTLTGAQQRDRLPTRSRLIFQSENERTGYVLSFPTSAPPGDSITEDIAGKMIRAALSLEQFVREARNRLTELEQDTLTGFATGVYHQLGQSIDILDADFEKARMLAPYVATKVAEDTVNSQIGATSEMAVREIARMVAERTASQVTDSFAQCQYAINQFKSARKLAFDILRRIERGSKGDRRENLAKCILGRTISDALKIVAPDYSFNPQNMTATSRMSGRRPVSVIMDRDVEAKEIYTLEADTFLRELFVNALRKMLYAARKNILLEPLEIRLSIENIRASDYLVLENSIPESSALKNDRQIARPSNKDQTGWGRWGIRNYCAIYKFDYKDYAGRCIDGRWFYVSKFPLL